MYANSSKFWNKIIRQKYACNASKNAFFLSISNTALKLQINGYAQCQWRERHGKKRIIHKATKKRKNTYYGHEDYIASSTYLVGSEDGTNVTIDAGTHTYSFACPIPINCPSSYEGAYGHIRYMVKVIFIRSGTSNRTTTKGFTVLKLLDLNRESALLRVS